MYIFVINYKIFLQCYIVMVEMRYKVLHHWKMGPTNEQAGIDIFINENIFSSSWVANKANGSLSIKASFWWISCFLFDILLAPPSIPHWLISRWKWEIYFPRHVFVWLRLLFVNLPLNISSVHMTAEIHIFAFREHIMRIRLSSSIRTSRRSFLRIFQSIIEAIENICSIFTIIAIITLIYLNASWFLFIYFHIEIAYYR